MYRNPAEHIEAAILTNQLIRRERLILSRAALIREMGAVPAYPADMSDEQRDIWEAAQRLATDDPA